VTVSGPAGSPESDGAFPTRRQARALRDAAAAAEPDAAAEPVATAGPRQHADAARAIAATSPAGAVPVPLLPVALVLPDLAVVVEAATTDRSDVVFPSASELSRPETAPPGATLPEPSPLTLLPATAAVPVIVLAGESSALPAATARTARPRARVAGPARPAPVRPSGPARRGARKPVAKLVTLLAIPALFLTAALPAYAFSPQGGAGVTGVQASADAQALTVSAAAAAVSISTDGFTATSQAELDDIEAGLLATATQQRAADAARASAAEFAVYGIRAEGDDYPWREAATDAQGGGLSPLGYYYRECVDFVAWRLNRDAGSTGSPWKWTWSSMTPGGGDGSAWAGAWAAKGWPTSSTPVVGAVASFSYNHVAYVQSVPGDGTVVLEEYNWMGSHAYHTRTVPIGDVPLYLYPPS
jgi:hypothetical protein